MSDARRAEIADVLREWLRNEKRLGIPVAPVAAGEFGKRLGVRRGAAVAPASATSPPVRRGGRSSPPDPGADKQDRMRDREPTRAGASAAPGMGRPDSAPAAVPLPQRLPGAARIPDDPRLPPLNTGELGVEAARAALADLNEQYVQNCRNCRLHEQRTQAVFGVGHPRPQLVFVGEGPGADEDAQGEPFVGRAGQLLTRMIAAMTLTREQVYICNVVKCRPPGNRTPTDDEMEVCAPLLFRQLAILRPRVIVALGRPASQTLLMTKNAMGRLRGRFHDFPTPELADWNLPAARVMPTYHPAYLLRNPAAKAEVWADLQEVMKVLGLKGAK